MRSTSRLTLLVLALALAVQLAASSASGAATSERARVAGQAVQATNAERVAHGLRPLRRNTCLERHALRHARRMARRAEMFHQDLAPVQRACGTGWIGENVARGYEDGQAVVGAWMASPGHRRNILFRPFQRIGLGAVRAHGTWWIVQLFSRQA